MRDACCVCMAWQHINTWPRNCGPTQFSPFSTSFQHRLILLSKMNQARKIDAIGHLNTEGVARLVSGDYDTAASSFHAALEHVKSLMNSAPESSDCLQSWDIVCRGVNLSHQTSMPSKCDVFLGGFLFFPPKQGRETPSSKDLELLTAILLFNMALVHHLRGLDCGKSQGKHMDRAKSLYHWAIDLVQGLDLIDATLWLALANNLAAVSLEAFDYTTLEGCLQWIETILSSEESPHFAFFASNLVSVGACQDQPAAAA